VFPLGEEQRKGDFSKLSKHLWLKCYRGQWDEGYKAPSREELREYRCQYFYDHHKAKNKFFPAIVAEQDHKRDSRLFWLALLGVTAAAIAATPVVLGFVRWLWRLLQ